MTRTLASGRSSSEAMTRWSQLGCWMELHTAIPSPSGAAMKRMRLDGELGDHGEGVGALDDHLRPCLGGGQVAPAVAMLAQDVAVGERVAGTQRRVLHERGARVQGARAIEETAGSSS